MSKLYMKNGKRLRIVTLAIAFLVWFGAGIPSNTSLQAATSCATPALGGPFSVDASGEVFIASRDAVARFAPGAHGNVAPAAILCGANTQLPSVGTDFSVGRSRQRYADRRL